MMLLVNSAIMTKSPRAPIHSRAPQNPHDHNGVHWLVAATKSRMSRPRDCVLAKARPAIDRSPRWIETEFTMRPDECRKTDPIIPSDIFNSLQFLAMEWKIPVFFGRVAPVLAPLAGSWWLEGWFGKFFFLSSAAPTQCSFFLSRQTCHHVVI